MNNKCQQMAMTTNVRGSFRLDNFIVFTCVLFELNDVGDHQEVFCRVKVACKRTALPKAAVLLGYDARLQHLQHSRD